MDVRMPDGVIVRNVPDGMGKDELLSRYQRKQRMAALPQSLANIEADQKTYAPTGSDGQNFAAGAGKAVVDLGRGAGQLVGAVSEQDAAASRALDAPLMATKAGKFGNFAGNVAPAALAAFVPGANTVLGAGAVGAGMGLLQPAESMQERLKNTAFGGVGGSVGQKVGQYVMPKLGQAIATRSAAAAEAKSLNSVRDATLAEARKLGYKIPPATVNQTSTTARAIESIAGKDSMKQTASVTNQRLTNKLVRQEFGLSNATPLSRDTLNGIRKTAGKAYEAVKQSGDIMADAQYLQEIDQLGSVADEIAADFPGMNFAGSAEVQQLQKSLGQQGFTASGAVEVMKKLRAEASKNLAWNVEDPSKKALGLAQREAAGIMEDQVIRHLQAQGKGGLATAFDKSRQTIAKTYSVQAALNEGSGNIVAGKLAAQLRKGKPLSGNLEKIARFASSVESGIVKEPIGSPGVSALVGTMSMGGGAGGLAFGSPELALVAAGLPFAREMTRRTLMTGPAQRLASPAYGAGNSPLQLMRGIAPLSAPVGIGLANAEQ
jgi:hypothetical protein